MKVQTQSRIKALLNYFFHSLAALALMVWKALNILYTGRMVVAMMP